MALAKELEPGTTMIPCGCMLTRRLYFFAPIFHLGNKKYKELFFCTGFQFVYTWPQLAQSPPPPPPPVPFRRLLWNRGSLGVGKKYLRYKDKSNWKESYQKLDSPCCREMLCLNTGTARPPNTQVRSRAERNRVERSTNQELWAMHYENNTDGLGHFSVVILNSDLVNSVIFYLLSRLRSIFTLDLSTTFVRNLVVLMAIS